MLTFQLNAHFMAKLPLLNEAIAQISLQCSIRLAEKKKVKSSLITVHIFSTEENTTHFHDGYIF